MASLVDVLTGRPPGLGVVPAAPAGAMGYLPGQVPAGARAPFVPKHDVPVAPAGAGAGYSGAGRMYAQRRMLAALMGGPNSAFGSWFGRSHSWDPSGNYWYPTPSAPPAGVNLGVPAGYQLGSWGAPGGMAVTPPNGGPPVWVVPSA